MSDDWRKVFVTQYSLFGAISGLEITALTIFTTFRSTEPLGSEERLVFTAVCFLLFLQVAWILWMINQERKVAAGEPMTCFRENERFYRNLLNLVIVLSWGLTLALLVLRVWEISLTINVSAASAATGSLPEVPSIVFKTANPPWDMLTAIGTVGAAVVALFVAFLPDIKGRRNSPRLRFEFENKVPFCRATGGMVDPRTGNITPRNDYFVRLQVKNFGRSVAKSCKGKLVAISHKDLGTLREDIDPVTLSWVGNVTQAVAIDINSKEYEYLDLISTHEQGGTMHIGITDRELPRGITINPDRDDYYLLVTVYSENAEPLSEVFKFTNHEEYNKVSLRCATSEEKVRFFNLLG